MDVLVLDVALQILIRSNTQSLANLLPLFSQEIKDGINTPSFWKARLQLLSPEVLKDAETFQMVYLLAEVEVNYEILARLVEYCKLKDCHAVVGALAMQNFPSREVITAVLALIESPLLTLDLSATPTSLLALKWGDGAGLRHLDPSKEDEALLVKTTLDCCDNNPQHLGNVWSYVWRYHLTESSAVSELIEGLANNLNGLAIALDTMDTNLAWYAQMRLLGLLGLQAMANRQDKLLEFLVVYCLDKHYYHVIVHIYYTANQQARDASLFSFSFWFGAHFSWLTSILSRRAPRLKEVIVRTRYNPRELDLDYPIPPYAYNVKTFPFPLVEQRIKVPLAMYYRRRVTRYSIFSTSKLIEMLFAGVDLLAILQQEVSARFYRILGKVEYRAFVILHRLAFERNPRLARDIFGSPAFKARVAETAQGQRNLSMTPLILYFLEQLNY